MATRQTKDHVVGSRVSRRRLLKWGAVGAGALMPFSIVPSRSRAAESLVFIAYGGSLQAAYERYFIAPFMRDTGVHVTTTSGPNLAKLKAQVQTGNIEWDVVVLVGAQGVDAEREGLLEKIDYSVVQKVDSFFPARERCFPFASFWGGVAYDPKRIPPERVPRTWSQFWDTKKFPGRRAIRDRVEESLEIALMADSVSPKQLYPLDVDRAFRALDRIKPHVTKFIVQTPQTISLVQSGEIDLSYTYAGRVAAAQADGISLDYVSGQPLVVPNYIGVTKGSKRRTAGMQLLSYFMRPDLQAAYNNAMPGNGVNARAAIPMLTGKSASLQPKFDDPDCALSDMEWWADNYPALSRRWKEWLLA